MVVMEAANAWDHMNPGPALYFFIAAVVMVVIVIGGGLVFAVKAAGATRDSTKH